MAQSLSSILIHLVFSTKNREPFITPAVEPELHPYLASVEEVKTESSKWIKTKGPEFRNFHWQAGYGAFSIGQSNVEALKRYIRGPKQHHSRMTFQDEYRQFLKRYQIDYDERYVWD